MAAILKPSREKKEYEHYLNDQRWGTFSTLKRYKNGSYAHQDSYRLNELPSVIDQLQELFDHDIWISQAAFTQFNRRKSNVASIGVCWVDLDYYRLPKWAAMSPLDFLYEVIFPFLRRHKIPFPSLVLDSGQGMYLKWLIENLPARALPRWDRLQTELCMLLAELGGDAHAKDASRVLRLENTFNQKTGNQVKVLWKNIDENLDVTCYSFNELCNAVLPFTQDELRKKREEYANRGLKGTKFAGKQATAREIVTLLSGRNRSLGTLNWNRLKDLQLLIVLRGGDIGEGLREPLAMYLCNFYALKQVMSGIPEMDIWLEFMQLCKEAAPHWDHNKARAKTNNIFQLFKRARAGETVEFAGRQYPVLYTPKNQTLIDLFQITPEEEKQLTTIISENEYKRRDKVRDEARRRARGEVTRFEYTEQRKAQSNVKAEQARVYASQGKTQKWIAQVLSINERTVRRYLTKKRT